MGRYLLGIDNGCTVSKAALFTMDGREIAVASAKTELLASQTGWSERDMDEMWDKTAQAVNQVIAKAKVPPDQIACVACTGHGNGLYLIDEKGEPTRNAVLSMDSRARKYVDKWLEDGIDKKVRPKTMQSVWPAQPNALLAWLRDNEPETMKKSRWVLMAKDYILRAIYEGVAFGHKKHVERLLKFRDMPDVIRLTGGAARSEVWLQIFADVFGVPVQVPDGTELGALGAAIAAGVAAGSFANYPQAVGKMVRFSKTVHPKRDRIDLYKAKYQRYNKVIEALDPVWKQLSRG